VNLRVIFQYPWPTDEAEREAELENLEGDTRTATRKVELEAPVDALLKIPGARGEHTRFEKSPTGAKNSAQWTDLKAKLATGYDAERPIVVWVTNKGPTIAEGNHRLRALAEMQVATVPTLVIYFEGADLFRRLPFDPDDARRNAKKIEQASIAALVRAMKQRHPALEGIADEAQRDPKMARRLLLSLRVPEDVRAFASASLTSIAALLRGVAGTADPDYSMLFKKAAEEPTGYGVGRRILQRAVVPYTVEVWRNSTANGGSVVARDERSTIVAAAAWTYSGDDGSGQPYVSVGFSHVPASDALRVFRAMKRAYKDAEKAPLIVVGPWTEGGAAMTRFLADEARPDLNLALATTAGRRVASGGLVGSGGSGALDGWIGPDGTPYTLGRALGHEDWLTGEGKSHGAPETVEAALRAGWTRLSAMGGLEVWDVTSADVERLERVLRGLGRAYAAERGAGLLWVETRASQGRDNIPVPVDIRGRVDLGELRAYAAGEMRREAAAKKAPQHELVALHNLTAANLRHALEIGGLIAPSIAVTRADLPFTSFGEITLVAPMSMVDPQRTPVFDADIYSPRYPSVYFEVNKKAWAAFEKKLNTIPTDLFYALGSDPMSLLGEVRRANTDLSDLPPLQYLFLRSKGIEFQPVKRRRSDEVRRPWTGYEPMRSVLLDPATQSEQPANILALVRASLDAWERATAAKVESAQFAKKIRDNFEKEVKRNVDEESGLLFLGYYDVLRQELKLLVDDPEPLDAWPTRKALAKAAALHKSEFDQWLSELQASLRGERYLMPGARKQKYTPDNILRNMTRQIRGGENFFYGLGSVRAYGAKRFRNMQGMTNASGQIVSTEEMKAHKTQLENELDALPFSQRAAIDAIPDYYKGRSVATALRESGVAPTDENVRALVSFAEKLRASPTEYFEAKPKRQVNISEFEGAVVPTSQLALGAQLQKYGLVVATYESDGANDEVTANRQAALGSVLSGLRTKRTASGELIRHVERLRPALATAAQNVIDAWQADEEDGDPELGFGGICDRVADAMMEVLGDAGIDVLPGGQDGDDHAWVVAYDATSACGVDIPPEIYETGAGFSWKKIEGAEVSPHDVQVWAIDRRDLGLDDDDGLRRQGSTKPRDDEQTLIEKVKRALTPDLRKGRWKTLADDCDPMTGHCYVASEALRTLLGPEWHPMFIKHEGAPHWFLKHKDGRILDVTSSQFSTPVPYDNAKGKGFLTREPSARTRTVLKRVRKRQASTETAARRKAQAATQAEAFAAEADAFADGLADSDKIEAALEARKVEYDSDRYGRRRYTFADGSGIVIRGSAWDVALADDSECFCFATAGHHEQWCPVAGRKLPDLKVLSGSVIETGNFEAACLLHGNEAPQERQMVWCTGKSRHYFQSYQGGGRRFVVLPDGPTTWFEYKGQKVPWAPNGYAVSVKPNGAVNVNDNVNRYLGNPRMNKAELVKVRKKLVDVGVEALSDKHVDAASAWGELRQTTEEMWRDEGITDATVALAWDSSWMFARGTPHGAKIAVIRVASLGLNIQTVEERVSAIYETFPDYRYIYDLNHDTTAIHRFAVLLRQSPNRIRDLKPAHDILTEQKGAARYSLSYLFRMLVKEGLPANRVAEALSETASAFADKEKEEPKREQLVGAILATDGKVPTADLIAFAREYPLHYIGTSVRAQTARHVAFWQRYRKQIAEITSRWKERTEADLTLLDRDDPTKFWRLAHRLLRVEAPTSFSYELRAFAFASRGDIIGYAALLKYAEELKKGWPDTYKDFEVEVKAPPRPDSFGGAPRRQGSAARRRVARLKAPPKMVEAIMELIETQADIDRRVYPPQVRPGRLEGRTFDVPIDLEGWSLARQAEARLANREPVRVEFVAGFRGSGYMPGTETIVIDFTHFSRPLDMIRGTVEHELLHLLQFRTGLGFGANTRLRGRVPDGRQGHEQKTCKVCGKALEGVVEGLMGHCAKHQGTTLAAIETQPALTSARGMLRAVVADPQFDRPLREAAKEGRESFARVLRGMFRRVFGVDVLHFRQGLPETATSQETQKYFRELRKLFDEEVTALHERMSKETDPEPPSPPSSPKPRRRKTAQAAEVQELTLYHGSQAHDIETFETSPAGPRGYFGTGVYTALDPETASFYGPVLYTLNFKGRVFDEIYAYDGETGDRGDVQNFLFELNGVTYGSFDNDPSEGVWAREVWANLVAVYEDVISAIADDETSVREALSYEAPRWMDDSDPRVGDVYVKAIDGLRFYAKRRDRLEGADIDPARREAFYDLVAQILAGRPSGKYFQIDHTDIGGEVESAGYDAVLIPGLERNKGHEELLVFDPEKLTIVSVTDSQARTAQASSEALARDERGDVTGQFIETEDGWAYREKVGLHTRGRWDITFWRSRGKVHGSVEGASSQSVGLQAAVAQIVERYPELTNVELRFDNWSTTFGAHAATSVGSFPERWYHGTSSTLLPAILRDGLRPRSATGVEPSYKAVTGPASQEDRVYFTTEVGTAYVAAGAAVRKHGGERVVLEVTGLAEEFAHPDEDARTDDVRESIERLGAIAYTGPVSPSKIRVVEKDGGAS
jgi:hypothetical protein